MKRLTPLLLACALLTGCARNYVITLNNGSHVSTVGKPKLEGSSYVGKDANGQPIVIPAGRVKEIAPASMSSSEKSPFIR